MKARWRLRTEPEAWTAVREPANYGLAVRIEGLGEEMDAALADGEYDRAVRLAEEQEKLLEALMI